jgi:acetyltransferase
MLKRVIQVGRDEKVQSIIALISPENTSMRKLCEATGFTSFEIIPETKMLKAEMKL